MYIVELLDKNDNRMDFNWFKHSFHQIAKLTSYATEERDLSQADSLYQILFSLPSICVIYNQKSSWKCQSANSHIITINSSFYCCC